MAAATAPAAGGAAASVAAGRLASQAALRPLRGGPPGSEQVTVHGADDDAVSVTRTVAASRPGRYALTGPDCHAVVGEVLSTTADTVTRRVERLERGGPVAGDRLLFTPQVHRGDPRTAHGLDFEETAFPGELGPLPAWYLPGTRDIWVITAHGLGATREQPLAVLPALCSLRLTVLDIGYRNDPGAPRSPDRIGHLGDTEWRDLDAALRYAVDQGAAGVVLYGWSVGATMALHTADRSPLREAVKGLVLDSPVLDWRRTLRRLAAHRGVPAPLLPLAVRAVEGRTALHHDRLDEAAHPSALSVPTLVLHGPDDALAPWERSRELAARRPDLVTRHTVRDADHAAMWNADPARYEEVLRRFLTPLL
ncbi:alpha/beta hydrolase [Streptomyces capparidis]